MLKFLSAYKPHRALNITAAVFICLLAGTVHAAAGYRSEIKTLRESAMETVLKHNLLWYEELPPAHQKEVAVAVLAREKQAQGELAKIERSSYYGYYQRRANETILAQSRALRLSESNAVDAFSAYLMHYSPVDADLGVGCCCCVPLFFFTANYVPEYEDLIGYSLIVLWTVSRLAFYRTYSSCFSRLVAHRLSSDGKWRINLQRAQALMQSDAPRPMRMDLQTHEKID